MKNRIKNILGAIISIIGLGSLIFVAYLRIQAHEYGALVWNLLGIIILLIAIYVYFKDAITGNNSDTEEDPDVKKVETNSKAKSLDIVSNLSFWGGFALMNLCFKSV